MKAALVIAAIVVLPCACLADGNKLLAVYEDYDRIPDETTLSVRMGTLEGPALEPLDLTLLYIYSGKKRPKAGKVAWAFSRSGDHWRYLDFRELVILADGARFKANPKHKGDIRLGGVSEVMIAPMEAKMLLDIAGVKDLEGKLGTTEFRLKPAQMAALREFAKCLDDPSYDPVGPRLAAEKREAEAKAAAEKREAEARAASEKKAAEEIATKEAADAEASEKLLSQAKTFDRANKQTKAFEIYRKIARQYPETRAGKWAEARMKAMMKARR